MRRQIPTIGPKLRLLRESKGLSLRACARASRINPGNLHRIEAGIWPLSSCYFGRLGRVLGRREVEEIALPGQVGLALDWRQAVRRDDLNSAARTWLAARARIRGAVQVWELPGQGFFLTPAPTDLAAGAAGS